jgi:hypothetical protein
MATKPKLMIGHCHANKARAQEIRGLLDDAFDILIDENYFEFSRSTKPEMKRMVTDAHVVLALLSPDSVKSAAVRYEVRCELSISLRSSAGAVLHAWRDALRLKSLFP